jgi:hypothetical protein
MMGGIRIPAMENTDFPAHLPVGRVAGAAIAFSLRLLSLYWATNPSLFL